MKKPKGIEDFLYGYEREYFLIHQNCIPLKWGGVKMEDREKVYKQTIEEGKTWEEVTGCHNNPDVIL